MVLKTYDKRSSGSRYMGPELFITGEYMNTRARIINYITKQGQFVNVMDIADHLKLSPQRIRSHCFNAVKAGNLEKIRSSTLWRGKAIFMFGLPTWKPVEKRCFYVDDILRCAHHAFSLANHKIV